MIDIFSLSLAPSFSLSLAPTVKISQGTEATRQLGPCFHKFHGLGKDAFLLPH